MFEQISGSISAVSAAGLRIDSRCVYLRGQTVDGGSYGGYVNTHAWRFHLAHEQTVAAALRYSVRGTKSGTEGPTERKHKEMTEGKKGPQKDS